MARRRLPGWLGGPRHVLPLSDALGLECKRTSRWRGNSGDADNRDALRGYRPKVSPHERIHIAATGQHLGHGPRSLSNMALRGKRGDSRAPKMRTLFYFARARE